MTELKNKSIVGIDVSKDKLDIYLTSTTKHVVIKNNKRAIGAWLKSLEDSELTFVLEPTGGYEKVLVQVLLEKSFGAFYVHPNKLVHYAKSVGQKAKTDKIAAKLLADYALSHPQHLREIPEHFIENKAIFELSQRRAQLEQDLHREKCRLKLEYYNAQIKKSIKENMRSIERNIAKLNQAIESNLKNNAENERKIKILRSVKGVGPKVAQTLLIELPELGSVRKQQIARLIGVAPMDRASGQYDGRRFIQGGRAGVRKMLYMAAYVSIKHNHTMRAFYDRLREKGKPYKVAIVAVMRKLIGILNAMLRDNNPWAEHDLNGHIA